MLCVGLSFRNLTLEQQKEWSANNQLAIKQLCVQAFTRLQQWGTQADLLESKFRKENDMLAKQALVSDWLKSEVQDLTACYKRGQQVLVELQKGLDSLMEQTNLVKSSVHMANNELDHLKEKLEECVHDLSLACKRQDRSQSKLVAALSFGGLGDMPDPSKKEETTGGGSVTVEKKPAKYQEAVVKPEAEQSSSNNFSSNNETGSLTEQVIKTQLEEHKLILTTREKEIEDLKRDRQLLLRDEERLLSLFTMGEDRLLETEYIKALQLSIEHYRDRCHHLEQKRVDIEREMDKVSALRQQLIEQAKAEKLSQGNALEGEMKRLEADLHRIRGQRDSLQTLVEEQKLKDARDKEAQDKIISFANQGKTRIASLETRIAKLKTDQEMAGPFAKEANTFKSLQESLRYVLSMIGE